jgi:low temperature requirement protein LtrA
VSNEPAADPAEQPVARERSSWAELFYDLVLVFALTQAATVLAADPGWPALGRSLLILAPIWWAWVGLALVVNSVAETAPQRLLILTAAGVTFLAAIAAPQAFVSQRAAVLFALAYLVLRLMLGESMRRKGTFPMSVNPYTVGTASGVVFVIGAFLPSGAREIVWAVAVACEMISPAALGHRLHGMRFGSTHLAERFGILVIIALGESVVSVGLTADHTGLATPVLIAFSLTFVLGAGLWWMYFNFGADAIEHALRTHRTQALVVRDVLSYGHFAFLLGLLLAAVGAREVVAHPTATPPAFTACLLPVGTGIFVLTFAFTRWRMFGSATWTRLSAGVVLLAASAVAPHLAAIGILSLAVAVVLAVNGFEYWIVATGRPLPLVSRRT